MSEPDTGAAAGSTRPMWIAAAIFLAILVAVGIIDSSRDLAAARARVEELKERVGQTEARIQALERRIERMSDDPLTLERLAREELGLVKPHELVIVLPKEGGPAPAARSPGLEEPAGPGP